METHWWVAISVVYAIFGLLFAGAMNNHMQEDEKVNRLFTEQGMFLLSLLAGLFWLPFMFFGIGRHFFGPKNDKEKEDNE